MTLKESKAEKILGIFFAVFGLLLAFLILPSQIHIVEKAPWYNQPRFFPYVVSGLFVLMGALLFLSGLKKGKRVPDSNQETYEFNTHGLKMVLITLGFIALYVAALSFLPYIPCTIIALGVLMWFFGQRDLRKLIPVAIVLPLVIYYSFTYLLKMRLP